MHLGAFSILNAPTCNNTPEHASALLYARLPVPAPPSPPPPPSDTLSPTAAERHPLPHRRRAPPCPRAVACLPVPAPPRASLSARLHVPRIRCDCNCCIILPKYLLKNVNKMIATAGVL